MADVNVEPLKNHVLGDSALTVRLIFAAALLVFVISWANVAHLVLARSTSRARDIAVRLALGASRVRLARGLLWESLLVSFAAAVAGLWLSTWAVRLLIALVPYRVPRLEDAHTGLAVLAFSVAVAALTAVVFVLTPLLAVRGLDLNGRSRKAPGKPRAPYDSAGSGLRSSQPRLQSRALCWLSPVCLSKRSSRFGPRNPASIPTPG